MPVVQYLLDLAGIGRDRMALRWVSAAEGQIFANNISELTQAIQKLGPFKADQHKLQLAALESVIRGPRMRWLMGMDHHVVDNANVYGDKVDPQYYQELVKQACEAEYQKALLLEALKEGPLSVREMAAKTGIPVYSVSLRLNDLEKRGEAELKGYEGATPKFIRPAA